MDEHLLIPSWRHAVTHCEGDSILSIYPAFQVVFPRRLPVGLVPRTKIVAEILQMWLTNNPGHFALITFGVQVSRYVGGHTDEREVG